MQPTCRPSAAESSKFLLGGVKFVDTTEDYAKLIYIGRISNAIVGAVFDSAQKRPTMFFVAKDYDGGMTR
jgi:hypothetical protein